MKMLLYASSPSSRSLVSCLSVISQVFITSLYLSSSVINPRAKFFAILSTVACAFFISSGLLAGTVISEIETVIEAIVEYLYPIAFMSSSTSAVLESPCTLITFSRICLHCFFFTRKSISGFNSLPGMLLSTNPRS